MSPPSSYTKQREKLHQAKLHAAAARGRPSRPYILHNMLDAQLRERLFIIAAVSKVKGLMPLLMKPRNGQRWTAAERTELHEQFRSLRHLSPYLLLLALPGSVLLLPVLAWWLDRRRTPRKAEQAPADETQRLTGPCKDT